MAGDATADKFDVDAESAEQVEKPTGLLISLWLILPMLASVLLLATTNLMTQEVGAMPFLWILPLSLYLISFIICFEHNRWYYRPIFFTLLFVSAAFSGFLLEAGPDATLIAQIVGYALACFACAMCCHGELSRIKPSTEHLTLFYLLIAIGGALGGVVVAIIAPRIFVNYYEFQLGLIAALMFTIFAYGFQVRAQDKKKETGYGPLAGFGTTLFFGLITTWIVIGSFISVWIKDHAKYVLSKTRNDYGTLTVKNYAEVRKLFNGRIEHGVQAHDNVDRKIPTTYYGTDSGLGIAIEFLQNRDPRHEDPLEFGAIGLGVGTVCTWGRQQDRLRIYEINQEVQRVAEEHFYYLSDTEAETEIVIGDARLQLERELAEGDARKFDILIADAFSSDSIPVHLLTLESFRIYRDRLTERGIIAVHTSNRFLELSNVVRRLANEIGMDSVIISNSSDSGDPMQNSSTWVLVTNNEEFLADTYMLERVTEWPEGDLEDTPLWTDDYASIVPLVRWSTSTDWFTDLIKQKFRSEEEQEENGE